MQMLTKTRRTLPHVSPEFDYGDNHDQSSGYGYGAGLPWGASILTILLGGTLFR